MEEWRSPGSNTPEKNKGEGGGGQSPAGTPRLTKGRARRQGTKREHNARRCKLLLHELPRAGRCQPSCSQDLHVSPPT